MKKRKSSLPSIATAPHTDSYSDDQPSGRVIGTSSPSGATRKGIDVENMIAIDNGALRIRPLAIPGWGREGIAYGPYTRTNGLAFSIFLVNGHNTSQAGDIADSVPRRLLRWAQGGHKENPMGRFWGWIRSDKRESLVRRINCWVRSSKKYVQIPVIDENLALGFFPNEVPSNPLTEGNAFVVHATGPENGELWVRVGANLLPALKGLQNLQVYYIVILREKGAAYYAASVPNTHGLVAYPNMRPLAIDPFNDDATVYAAVYQSVLGQIGFSVDTRVYGVQVEQIPELTTWYGTAHAGDRLMGNSVLDGSQAEAGGFWRVYEGSYERTEKGLRPTGTGNLAVLYPDAPSGLIHTAIATPAVVPASSILWRVQDENNFWSLLMDGENCQLWIQEDGTWTNVASFRDCYLQPNVVNSAQILDNGKTFSLYLNGKLVFQTEFADKRLQNATGVGLYVPDASSSLYFHSFEAHPRRIPIPTTLDLGAPWVAESSQAIITDDFDGATGDLVGKTTNTGGKVWRKDIGVGVIELTGSSTAKVRASPQHPNPGRTAYTVSWDNPDFADVQLDITPPGTQRKQGEKGRGGLIFWQDANNYITISTWLDDSYGGASISSFFYLKGFEDLYDAVWTNVGSRVYWGIPYTLRVVFDGMNYTAFVNDEPVLYRALTDVYPDTRRLDINRIGIVSNWEWGNDTGSVFDNFVAKI